MKTVILASLALGLLAGNCQAEQQCDRHSGRTNFTVDGKNAFLLGSCIDQTRGWVWYAPTRDDQLPDMYDDLLLSKLRKSGIAVAGVDVGDFYGAPYGLAVYDHFYKVLITEYQLDPRPTLYGRSRGGLELMGWARNNAEKVRGFAGVYPVLNLASFPGLDKASKEYGVTEDELRQMLPRVNPIETYMPLAAQHVPVYISHGIDDVVVPYKQNIEIFNARYKKAGGDITMNLVPGQGHNAWEGWWSDPKIFGFIASKY